MQTHYTELKTKHYLPSAAL